MGSEMCIRDRSTEDLFSSPFSGLRIGTAFSTRHTKKNRPVFIFCSVLVAVISVRLAAFRREVVSGMRGPTQKQPRCILNLRDHRFESALTGGH